MTTPLQSLVSNLRASGVFEGKHLIDCVKNAFGDAFSAWGIQNGDDAAAVPDGHGGYLLLAAEGVLPELVQHDPELAGRCAVLANVNDIYAMGGRPLAMVDVIGAQDDATLQAICKGMRDNALRFGVPLVGGHVQSSRGEASASLAIMGSAKALLTSFDACAGDALVLVTQLDGIWLRKQNYWNCTLPRHDAHLQGNLELLPRVAEEGLTRAGKDVSMAGIAGTTIMLAEASGIGAIIDVDAVPLPQGAVRERDLEAWLRAFFSYGFLLAVQQEHLLALTSLFLARGLYAARIGEFTTSSSVQLQQGGESALLHDWKQEPFTGFAKGAQA
ncbi:MAG: sll0787 family AIR synthase-like protein [Desulfovibrionaceae bacterium]|nr:sll0787 family AIR synthase-like protein [Desulfovibrionaceae bacterium]